MSDASRYYSERNALNRTHTFVCMHRKRQAKGEVVTSEEYRHVFEGHVTGIRCNVAIAQPKNLGRIMRMHGWLTCTDNRLCSCVFCS